MTTAVAGLVALLFGLLSGALLALAGFLSLPAPLLAAALGGLAVSVSVTGACVFADARRNGHGLGRSIARSGRMALSWLAMLVS